MRSSHQGSGRLLKPPEEQCSEWLASHSSTSACLSSRTAASKFGYPIFGRAHYRTPLSGLFAVPALMPHFPRRSRPQTGDSARNLAPHQATASKRKQILAPKGRSRVSSSNELKGP